MDMDLAEISNRRLRNQLLVEPKFDTAREVGAWMGATPELFLRYHSGVAETIALAGTRPAEPDKALPRWSSKERHEQQLVTDYIVAQMRALGLKPQMGGVRDIRAGKLWHLGTSIRTFIAQDDVRISII